MPTFSRILAPVDFSDRSLGMLSVAKTIASRYGATLTLLHVVNPVYTVPATGPFGPLLVPAPASVFEEANKRLEQFGREVLAGLKVDRQVYEGDPPEQILQFARSERVDLIVMATHGFGLLRRFLIGSVAAKVLHDAACPVLTGVHMEPRRQPPPGFRKILCAVDLGPASAAALAMASRMAADFDAAFEALHVTGDNGGAGDERERLGKLCEGLPKPADSIVVHTGDPAGTVAAYAGEGGADLLVIGRGERDDGGGLKGAAYAIIRQAPCPVLSV
jgi:nucleotide-binding universal stress UspA family protein